MKTNTKKLTPEERLLNAIEASKGKMGNIEVIQDKSLHQNEKECRQQEIYEEKDKNGEKELIWSDGWNVIEKPYAYMENINKLPNLEPNCMDENEEELKEKDDLFYQNLNKKYMKYIDNIEQKVGKTEYVKKEKVKLPWFKNIRKKLASEIFERKLRESDKASDTIGYKRVITQDYYNVLTLSEACAIRNLFNGELKLNISEKREFFTLKNVWNLFKFTLKTKYEHVYNKCYGYVLSLVKEHDYYGYSDLEEMMNATGGIPYHTFLSNNGINPDTFYYFKLDNGNIIDIRKEQLKEKIKHSIPTQPEDIDIEGFLKNLEEKAKVEVSETSEPNKETVEEAVERAKKLIESDEPEGGNDGFTSNGTEGDITPDDGDEKVEIDFGDGFENEPSDDTDLTVNHENNSEGELESLDIVESDGKK